MKIKCSVPDSWFQPNHKPGPSYVGRIKKSQDGACDPRSKPQWWVRVKLQLYGCSCHLAFFFFLTLPAEPLVISIKWATWVASLLPAILITWHSPFRKRTLSVVGLKFSLLFILVTLGSLLEAISTRAYPRI